MVKYDVHFSIAGLIVYTLLLLVLNTLYRKEQKSVRKLKDVIEGLFVADVLDIISAYTIMYATTVPVWLNTFLTGAFFVLQNVNLLLVVRYVRHVGNPNKEKRELMEYVNLGIIIIFILLVVSSPVTKLIFYFDGAEYIKGPLYNSSYVVALYFLLYALVYLLRKGKGYTRRQAVSVIGFVSTVLVGALLQLLTPGNVLLLYFLISIACTITVFGLETPDYIKLVQTLDELETSQEELKKAVERAEAADRAKSDFLANMSHEIRTPINAILGMNELINRESNQEEIREYSGNLADAGNSLLSLINDILDFSKIEAGRMELSPTDYDFANLLHEVCNIIEIRCEDKNLSFEVKNNEDMPKFLYGDDVRIRQILINLLNNALKYTDAGSVTLEIDFRPTDSNRIEVILAVRDTGVGIKEENLNKLFESFKRIDLKKNRKREGTGLGLAITKSFVEMMDGYIEVESVYGEGSVFTAHIKQVQRGDETIGVFDKDSFKATKKGKYQATFTAPEAKILVVDDVKINISVVKGLLKQTGINIDAAYSGYECLELIKKERYDIIFLDHMMPEMDGVETLAKMKEDSTHMNQNTPVIMLTANAILGAKEEYLAGGFVDYLSKPIKWEELEAMLKKYLPCDKIK